MVIRMRLFRQRMARDGNKGDPPILTDAYTDIIFQHKFAEFKNPDVAYSVTGSHLLEKIFIFPLAIIFSIFIVFFKIFFAFPLLVSFSYIKSFDLITLVLHGIWFLRKILSSLSLIFNLSFISYRKIKKVFIVTY